MKKRAVLGDPTGGFFEGMLNKPGLIRSVSTPELKKEVFQSESSLFHNTDSSAFFEEKKLMDNMNKDLFNFDDKSSSTGCSEQDSSNLGLTRGGFKRTASGLTRRNVSSNNLTLIATVTPKDAKVSPESTPLTSPFGSCPDLKEAKKKQLRLERNRNAARLRRHKRRLVVETLAKERNYMELTYQFIQSVRKLLEEDFQAERLFGLSETSVRQILDKKAGLQEHINYLIRCSAKNYQITSVSRTSSEIEMSERSLLATIIGTPLEGKSWCPRMKQKAVEFFLFHQAYQADNLRNIGRINVLLSMLGQKDGTSDLWLSPEQRSTLNSLIKGLVAGQIRLKLVHKIAKSLVKRITSGQMVVPFPTLENGMNAFRSVLTDDQLERFYRLAEETFSQKR